MQRLRALFCVLLLAGCSHADGSSTLPAAPDGTSSARSRHAAAAYTPIFSFKGTNGKEPDASLIDVNGALYGTTYGGGTTDDGTAFEVTTSGTLTVLHSFTDGTDGALPYASLLDVNGALYGTTVNGGGPSDEGVVFTISGSGAESIVHRFTGSSDGANPYAPLTDVNGTLYGTTAGGGANSAGTLYTISTSGAEKVIYAFGASSTDGSTPMAGLTDVNKTTLYGTTAYGGANCATVGCGTFFRISTSGTEKVLYSFKGGTSDGSMPASALADVNGTFYGTTLAGGSANVGTVFAVTSSGKESVVYSFKGGSADGALPQGVIAVNGTLYGTTSEGGPDNDGTVFSLTPSGSETILYSFSGGKDGGSPQAGLLDVNGTLYGTTALGGQHKVGTVFSITP